MIDTLNYYFTYFISTHFAAGAAGALVRYSSSKIRSTSETIIGGVAGALTASYATPAVTTFLNVSEEAPAYGISFVLGIIGLYLVEALVRIAQKYAQNPVIPSSLSVTGIVDAYQESINNNNNKNNNDGTNGQTEKSEKP